MESGASEWSSVYLYWSVVYRMESTRMEWSSIAWWRGVHGIKEATEHEPHFLAAADCAEQSKDAS